MTTYLNPPAECDLCHANLDTDFADAKIPRFARWGNVCLDCAKSEGVRYGTGLGQRYQLKDDGRFHKVEG